MPAKARPNNSAACAKSVARPVITPVKRKATSMVDQVDEDLAYKVKRAAKQKSEDSKPRAERVQARLVYNFPGWGPEELDGHLVHGISLRERINEDTRMNDLSMPDAPVMHKLYYEGMRAIYASPTAAHKKLTVANPAEVVDAHINKALESIVVSGKNYGLITALLDSLGKVNQKT